MPQAGVPHGGNLHQSPWAPPAQCCEPGFLQACQSKVLSAVTAPKPSWLDQWWDHTEDLSTQCWKRSQRNARENSTNLNSKSNFSAPARNSTAVSEVSSLTPWPPAQGYLHKLLSFGLIKLTSPPALPRRIGIKMCIEMNAYNPWKYLLLVKRLLRNE